MDILDNDCSTSKLKSVLFWESHALTRIAYFGDGADWRADQLPVASAKSSKAGWAGNTLEDITMNTNEQVVRDFIAAWSRLDVNEIVSFFAPDGTYHNMMNRPVTGHDNLQKFIGGFIKDWTQTTWDVLNVVSHGDIVVAERLDRTRVADRSVDLPCCGVFELSNGKIKVWRDYFDLATYTRAIMPTK